MGRESLSMIHGAARKLVRECLRSGWTLSHGKHKKLRSPDGKLVVISSSSSDQNAERNIVRDIQRIIDKETGK